MHRKIFLTKYFFQKYSKKSKKVIFRDLKSGAGVQKVALNIFCWFWVKKNFAGLFLTYMQEKSAIWATRRPLLLG